MDAHPIHLHLVQFQLINRQSFDPDGYVPVYEAAFPGGSFIPAFGPPNAYNYPAAGKIGGNPDVTPFLQPDLRPPLPNEAGWKDTVIMRPGEVTRIAVRFTPTNIPLLLDRPGLNQYPFDPTKGPGYVWHCHIVDHEDNEMMRPYHPVK
jgi:spore coat protein A, manganese oxidase